MKSEKLAIKLLCLLILTIGVAHSFYVWPEPYEIIQGTETIAIEPSFFTLTTTSTSPLLHNAIHRYLTQGLIFPFPNSYPYPSSTVLFASISITVNSDSEELQLGVSENYTLSINYDATSGTIVADTVFGALRGLETFSQLVDWNDETRNYAINCLPVQVTDYPRFQWRGLLVDTARHYLDPTVLFRAIDALSYSKFNTLHWHVSDAQSFPMVIESFPLLSQKGAYARRAIYPPSLVKDIVEYGRSRGIRVVPEFDMPGHTYSWGQGYPITTNCPTYSANTNNINLNPTLNQTYEVISGILNFYAETFIDNYVHIGGDEVVYGCWLEDASIDKWMKENGVKTPEELEQYFEDNVAQILSTLPGKNAVVWEDLYDNGVSLPKNYIIETWSEKTTLEAVIKDGYKAINAYGWYLDQQQPNGESTYQWINTWQIFYHYDPIPRLNATKEEKENVIGGEGCMWGEAVNSINFDSRVWPRACAIAERLWSQASVLDLDYATDRLREHSCRIARRGIGAGPIEPDWCSFPWSYDPVSRPQTDKDLI